MMRMDSKEGVISESPKKKVSRPSLEVKEQMYCTAFLINVFFNS